MKQPTPIGIIILIIFFVLAIVGYIFATLLMGFVRPDFPSIQRLIGFVSFIAMICTVYFLMKPSAFGWKFILSYLVLSLVNSLIQMMLSPSPLQLGINQEEMWRNQMINVFGSVGVTGIIFWYIYKKKDYFYGIPKVEYGREDVLDDENWE